MKESKNIGFEYPCVVGFQGGQRVVTLQVSFGALSRFLANDNFTHTLERSQRELNSRRASAFADYVLNAVKNETGYIIPPLIGNCDGELTFRLMAESLVGYVTIPMDAQIRLFDGQHRQAGIAEVLQRMPEIRDHSVSVMLTDNLPLNIRQQYFADINGNSSRPSAAINIAYDQTNVTGQTVKRIVLNNSVLAEKVDFERNSVSSRSKTKWVSFKALNDATERFCTYSKDGEIVRRSDSELQAIWDGWVAFSGLNDTHGYAYGEYNKEWLTFTSVMINAFGFAVKKLLDEMNAKELSERLKIMGEARYRVDRENYFFYANWRDSCVSGETGKVIANTKGQRAAAVHLYRAIHSSAYVF